MNDQAIGNTVRQDDTKIKKDLNTLVGDGAVRFNKLEDNISRVTGIARDGITTWVEDGVAQFNQGYGKLTGEAKETLVDAAATVTKDVGHGLSEYNAKAQQVANKIPGSFGEKAARYPWVAMSAALAVGFLLGVVVKSARQSLG
jgi:hypothetical protein